MDLWNNPCSVTAPHSQTHWITPTIWAFDFLLRQLLFHLYLFCSVSHSWNMLVMLPEYHHYIPSSVFLIFILTLLIRVIPFYGWQLPSRPNINQIYHIFHQDYYSSSTPFCSLCPAIQANSSDKCSRSLGVGGLFSSQSLLRFCYQSGICRSCDCLCQNSGLCSHIYLSSGVVFAIIYYVHDFIAYFPGLAWPSSGTRLFRLRVCCLSVFLDHHSSSSLQIFVAWYVHVRSCFHDEVCDGVLVG